MLTEQKRYLYLLHITLSWGFAVFFGILERLVFSPQSNGFPPLAPLGWLMYYLLPLVVLLALLSRWLWFGKRRRSSKPNRLHPAALIILISIVLGIGLFFYYRPPLLTGYVLSLTALLILNTLIGLLVRRSGPESNLIKSVIIAGTGVHAKNLAKKIDRHPEWGIRVTGFLSAGKQEADAGFSDHRVLGTVESIGAVLNQCIADMVLMAPEKENIPFIDIIVHRCRLEGIDTGFVTELNLPISPDTTVAHLGDLKLWIIRFVPGHPERLFLKRCIDLTASVAAFCLFLPVWVMVPVLIRLDSPGPVLFRQTRAGKNGRPFTMFKFRSMVVDAESRREKLMHLNEMDGPTFKLKTDPRVTKIGDFLRKTSLDELPQLFNVVKGDISLVGPRPALFEEVRQYHPWEKRRLSVLQGITGLWQRSGRNEIKFDEWMKLDLMYIDQWRFSRDLLILIKTIPAVIARKGAR